MRCHVCNVAVGDGQRFCHECGQELTGVTDPTEAVDEIAASDVADGATTASAAETSSIATSTFADDPTEPLDVLAWLDETEGSVDSATEPSAAGVGAGVFVASEAPTKIVPADEAGAEASAATGRVDVIDTRPASAFATDELPVEDQPMIFDGSQHLVEHPEGREPFRIRPIFVLACFTMIATLMASVADIVDIRTDRAVDGIDVGFRTMSDLGSNLDVAGFIGAAFMMVGALLRCFGFRWGAGMAGGAGLALVGWAALVVGLAEIPIEVAETITRDPSTPGPFLLTITRDVGYWLLIGIAALALFVFLFSIGAARHDGTPGLNPWLAAVGAVGAVVAATGPLIPLGGEDISVNFGAEALPELFFAGRLAQVGLFAVAGVVGFLSVRVYGLGLVGGGISVGVWMWLTTLVDFGDRPIGFAAGNLGSTSNEPHAVTSVGMIITIVMLLAAILVAAVQRSRAADSA
jgi:hypothetical protein